MDLILTVIADPNGTNMINHTKAFANAGGTLGRSDKNDWVLPDPDRIISSQHCKLDYKAPNYVLTDTSTNGVFLNDGPAPLGNGKSHTLCDGDTIGLGEYKLRVSLRAPAKPDSKLPQGLGAVDFLDESDKTTFSAGMAPQLEAKAQAQQFDDFLEAKPNPPAQQPDDWGFASDLDAKPGLDTAGATDPLSIFDKPQSDVVSNFGAPSPSPEQGWDDDWWKDGSTADHADPLAHNMQPPAAQQPAPQPMAPPPVAPPPQMAPAPQPAEPNPFAASAALVQPTAGEPIAPAPMAPIQPQVTPPPAAPAPVAPQLQSAASLATPMATAQVATAPQQPGAPSGPQQHSLQAALGLGHLNPAQLPNLLETVSAIIKETTTRLIDLLRARNSIKNELRVQRTMIQSADNNPLKFSATATDALNSMFAGNSNAFMTPLESVQDSFDDLSDHQVAVLAGMRAAYNAMFKHFSPKTLEARFNHSGSLLASKQAKNWASYCDYYQSLCRDRETTYEDLFGEEFAAAYEKQLTDLKNARALSRRNKK